MKTFKAYLEEIGEYGEVVKIRHPIATVTGIPSASPKELVLFETGEMGEIFSLDHDSVEVLIFSKTPIVVGTKIVRTGTFISVPVGKELLGATIDPLGNPLFSPFEKNPEKILEIERPMGGIYERARIDKPLYTGISLVDMMIPLGKGQRELIIGDRKTGKTSLLFSIMKKQAEEGTVIIYAAIARKKSDIKAFQQQLSNAGILKHVVIVATSSDDSPSLIYLNPQSAMTIAEGFKDDGIDSLVILDDLSTHAKYYREISLIAGRFPGRDSYPGDIFYTHAQLIERAGNFKGEKGSVAISCLPVVETVEGDLTGYIATNLMGMTDGHIFFDSNLYHKGRRPAINISLSVTRVGKQTQSSLKRDISRELASFAADFEKMQDFSHFGAELSGKVKSILKTGDILYQFFDQHYGTIVPETVQIIMYGLIWIHAFDEQSLASVTSIRDAIIFKYHEDKEVKEMLDKAVLVSNKDELYISVTKLKDSLLKYAQ